MSGNVVLVFSNGILEMLCSDEMFEIPDNIWECLAVGEWQDGKIPGVFYSAVLSVVAEGAGRCWERCPRAGRCP